MKDLKFDNQRGASMACDLVDVVRCTDCLFSTCETYYAGHVVCGDIILGCMFAGFYALGVSAGKAATRQEPENSIAMEHRHGGEDD